MAGGTSWLVRWLVARWTTLVNLIARWPRRLQLAGLPLYVNISRRRSFIRESRVRVSVSESSPYRRRSASFQSRLVTGSVVVVSRRSSGAHRELRANWISIANYFN